MPQGLTYSNTPKVKSKTEIGLVTINGQKSNLFQNLWLQIAPITHSCGTVSAMEQCWIKDSKILDESLENNFCSSFKKFICTWQCQKINVIKEWWLAEQIFWKNPVIHTFISEWADKYICGNLKRFLKSY